MEHQHTPESSAGGSTPDERGGPRYATLADYLRVLRRQRVLILLITVAVTALAIGYSLLQNPRYEAAAQLSFQDPLASIEAFDTARGAPTQSPAVRTAANAELIRRPAIARRVKRQLDTRAPLGALQGAISTTIGVQTQLVSLKATWSEAEFAARLANAFAEQTRRVTRREEITRIRKAEGTLRDELRDARAEAPPSPFKVSILEAQLSRVRTLREIVDPVEIVRPASVPGGPVSPNRTRNALMGGFFGLILALLLAFVRDSLDRRMHSAHDVHAELGLPVLGRVNDTTLGTPGLAANGARRMYDFEFESFRVLRTNLAALNTPIRSILVTSALPEEGKTTVSMALASAAAAAGQSVLLVECDLRRPSFERRLGVRRVPGLSDYLLGKAAPRDILQVVKLTEPRRVNGAGSSAEPANVGQLVCIAAGSPAFQSAELLTSTRFTDFIERVSKAYDLVVLDSSPLLSVADSLEIVPHADCVMFCVRISKTSRDQARAAHSAISRLTDRPMGAVITGIRRGDADSYEYYYGY